MSLWLAQLGLLKISDQIILNEKDLKKTKSTKVCIICTGSQGEPRAAISMMSEGRHPLIEIDKNDTVISLLLLYTEMKHPFLKFIIL